MLKSIFISQNSYVHLIPNSISQYHKIKFVISHNCFCDKNTDYFFFHKFYFVISQNLVIMSILSYKKKQLFLISQTPIRDIVK